MKGTMVLYFVLVYGRAFIRTASVEPLLTGKHIDCIPEGSVSLNITYYGTKKPDSSKEESYEGTTNLADNPAVSVNCTASRAQVTILPLNTSIEIILLFSKTNDTSVSDLFLEHVAVGLVEKNVLDNKITKRRKEGYGFKDQILLFESIVNKTGICGEDGKVQYISRQPHASFVFSNVRLHPLNYPDDRNKVPGTSCYKEMKFSDENGHNEFLVPVILAVSLVVVISLLVTGFLVHRKIEGMGYTNME